MLGYTTAKTLKFMICDIIIWNLTNQILPIKGCIVWRRLYVVVVVVYHVTIVAIGHMLNKGFERPLSSKQEMEIRLEPESNLVRCTGEPGLPGCNYFCQVVDDVRGG